MDCRWLEQKHVDSNTNNSCPVYRVQYQTAAVTPTSMSMHQRPASGSPDDTTVFNTTEGVHRIVHPYAQSSRFVSYISTKVSARTVLSRRRCLLLYVGLITVCSSQRQEEIILEAKTRWNWRWWRTLRRSHDVPPASDASERCSRLNNK
jgi:hypothetical protein